MSYSVLFCWHFFPTLALFFPSLAWFAHGEPGDRIRDGCPYMHPVACGAPDKARFLSLWKQKTRCWLCVEITQDLVKESVEIVRQLAATDFAVTSDQHITRPWLDTCLPVYVLAMFMTTRSAILQTWNFYEFGIKILWNCQYEPTVFFDFFGVTPGQLIYVFSLIGQKYAWSPMALNLQAEERGQEIKRRVWEMPLVIDVGMGLGADSRYYLRQGFKVVSVEANSMSIDAALEDELTLPFLKSGQFTVLNAAVAGPESNITDVEFFVLPHRPEQSKALSWVAQDGGKEVKVRTVQCADLIRVYGAPTYMKIDIEFNTIDCIDSLVKEAEARRAVGDKRWSLPQYLSAEVEAAHLVPEFYERLRRLGYGYYKITRQFVFSPAPCEMGQYSSQVLGCGSGPFASAAVDYIAGVNWRNLSELPNDTGFVKELDEGYDWFDLHAKLAD